MKLAFRVDASSYMGIGHAMRCLTLADACQKAGVNVQIITRNLEANIIGSFCDSEYLVSVLSGVLKPQSQKKISTRAYDSWLPVPWEQDASETLDALGEGADCLVVDHYGIGDLWHQRVRQVCQRIIVIDDLADRDLDCDMVLDQTYGRTNSDYLPYVPENCRMLLGTDYALLRESFQHYSKRALQKRNQFSKIKQIMICMGGGDEQRTTQRVLSAVLEWRKNKDIVINVIFGAQAKKSMQELQKSGFNEPRVNILFDITNMAELMFECDVAIGAGGSMSWERCALSLPSLILVEDGNQKLIAERLQSHGAGVIVTEDVDFDQQIIDVLCLLDNSSAAYKRMAYKAHEVCDGQGVHRVVKELIC